MEWDFINEVGRKIIHLTILFVFGAYFFIKNLAGKEIALLSLVGLLAFFLMIEFFRLDLGWKMPFFSAFIRPREQNRMFGVIFFLSGTIISFAVFDVKIALLALMMATFGDLMAAIFGRRYGTTLLFKNKTVVGFFAGLITNFIVGFIIAFVLSVNFYIPIVMALVATIVETLVDEIDDNLTVPVFAGLFGQVLFLIL